MKPKDENTPCQGLVGGSLPILRSFIRKIAILPMMNFLATRKTVQLCDTLTAKTTRSVSTSDPATQS